MHAVSLPAKNRMHKKIKIIGIFFSLCVMEIVFLFLGSISFSRHSYFKEHFENFSREKITIVITLFCIALILYGILWICREGFQYIQKTILAGILILMVATCVVIPPFLSRDIAAYLFPNKNALVYGVNMFSSPIALPQTDSWSEELGSIWWLEIPTPYGPLFHGITTPLVFFARDTTLSYAQDIYKILNAGIFLLSIFIVVKLTQLLSLSFATPYLYAFNPALLVQGVLEGHNDIWLATGILLFLYAFIRKKNAQSILFFVSSVALKYISIILIPVFLVKNKIFQRKRHIFFLIGIISIGYVALLIIHFPLRDTLERLLSRFTLPCFYMCTPFVSLVHSLFGKVSQPAQIAQIGTFTILYGWIYYFFLIKNNNPIKFCFWVFIALFFVLTSWMTPWYFITVIALGMLLLKEKKYAAMMFALTVYSLLHYVL